LKLLGFLGWLTRRCKARRKVPSLPGSSRGQMPAWVNRRTACPATARPTAGLWSRRAAHGALWGGTRRWGEAEIDVRAIRGEGPGEVSAGVATAVVGKQATPPFRGPRPAVPEASHPRRASRARSRSA